MEIAIHPEPPSRVSRFLDGVYAVWGRVCRAGRVAVGGYPGKGPWSWIYLSEAEEVQARAEKPIRASRTGARTDGSDILTQLYRKYSPALFWVCLRYTRDHRDAEDMVHEVFVKVGRYWSGFKGQSQVYTWMYRIAVNECIQMLRKRKYEARFEPSMLDGLAPVFPEGQFDAKLTLERILHGMDPKTGEILFLLYMEGLTQEEVAETLGISRASVNRRISAFKSTVGKYR